MIIDPDNGNIIEANKAASEFYGWSVEELLRMNIYAINTLTPPEIKKEIKRAKSLKKTQFEFKHRKADGAVIDVEVFSSKVMIEGKEYLHSIIHDITERKQAEEALERQYKLLKIAGETARFGGWNVDLKKNISTWSDAVADIHEVPHGYAPPVEDGINFYAPEWREKISKVFTDCAKKGIPYDEEMEIITSKGNRVWVRTIGRAVKDEKGSIIKMQGSFQDITERKRLENDLRISENRLNLAMAVKNEGIWDWNPVTNETFFDDRYYTMAGYAPNAFPQNFAAWRAHVHPDDLPHCDKEIRAFLAGQSERFDIEFRFERQDGSWMWIRGLGKIVERNADGSPLRVIGTHTDITERKQAEERIEHLLLVLRAIRDVNQLITHEEDRDELLRKSCDILISTRGYRSAWVALRDADGKLESVAESGIGEDFAVLRKAMQKGKWPECCRKALENPDGVVAIATPVLNCKKCSLSHSYRETAALAGALRHGEHDYGTMVVALPAGMADDPEEQSLFHELVGDVAYALYAMESTKQRREEETKFRSYVENAPYGIFISDSEGHYIDVNPGACDITGYSREELLGMSIPDLLAPDSRKEGAQHFQTLVESGRSNGEFGFVRKDGELRQWHVLAQELSPDRFLGFVEDITEQKAREEHISLLGRMLDAAPACITIHDTDGHFIFANTKNIELHGYDSLEDFLKVNLHDLDVPASETLLAERFRKIAEDGEARFEVAHYKKDGSTFPLDIVAKQIKWEGHPAILSIATDITERKQSEEALAESEEHHRVLFDQSREAMMTLTPPSWQFTSGNPAALELFGVSSQAEFLNLGPWDTSPEVQPDGRPSDQKAREMIETAMLKGSQFFEWTHQNMDGEPIPCTVLLNRMDVGDETFLLATVRDISKLKRVESEREELQTQLAQSQKMESVGRLAGGVAHDFNNMLSVIIGNAELALGRIPPDDALRADLKEILNAAGRSTDITRQLLAFARKQTISPEALNLNDTVEGMLKMLRRLIGENIDLAWQPGKNLTPVKVDPSQIDQILANLCVNARDAITGAGKLTIETGNVSFDEQYCAIHAGFTPGDYVMLAVSDDGCGMDRETVENIFEPFFTTKGVGKGTGLGLSTVYGIVKQNDGFINVYSEPDQGTTFKIYLPSHGDEKAEAKARESTEIPAGKGETVLIVEDEASILDLAQTILETLGYNVLAAATPGKATALAKKHSGDIHLLITDVVMPEMNGKDLAAKLKTSYPDLKVLFMSGYTANVIAHQGVLDEGVNFIPKPFTTMDLAIKIREALKEV